MKVTIEGVVFEGTPDEVYEILNKLGYKIKRNDLPYTNPITPATNPYTPFWTQPYTIGDLPPGTYPGVWCGTSLPLVSLNDAVVGEIPPSDDLDKIDS